MKKILINNTANTLQLLSADVASGESYEVQQNFWDKLAAATYIHDLIISGDVILNDGDVNLSKRIGLGLASHNHAVINEYYTLNDSGEILIGNGQILYLDDDTWPYDENDIQEDT